MRASEMRFFRLNQKKIRGGDEMEKYTSMMDELNDKDGARLRALDGSFWANQFAKFADVMKGRQNKLALQKEFLARVYNSAEGWRELAGKNGGILVRESGQMKDTSWRKNYRHPSERNEPGGGAEEGDGEEETAAEEATEAIAAPRKGWRQWLGFLELGRGSSAVTSRKKGRPRHRTARRSSGTLRTSRSAPAMRSAHTTGFGVVKSVKRFLGLDSRGEAADSEGPDRPPPREKPWSGRYGPFLTPPPYHVQSDQKPPHPSMPPVPAPLTHLDRPLPEDPVARSELQFPPFTFNRKLDKILFEMDRVWDFLGGGGGSDEAASNFRTLRDKALKRIGRVPPRGSDSTFGLMTANFLEEVETDNPLWNPLESVFRRERQSLKDVSVGIDFQGGDTMPADKEAAKKPPVILPEAEPGSPEALMATAGEQAKEQAQESMMEEAKKMGVPIPAGAIKLLLGRPTSRMGRMLQRKMLDKAETMALAAAKKQGLSDEELEVLKEKPKAARAMIEAGKSPEEIAKAMMNDLPPDEEGAAEEDAGKGWTIKQPHNSAENTYSVYLSRILSGGCHHVL